MLTLKQAKSTYFNGVTVNVILTLKNQNLPQNKIPGVSPCRSLVR